MKKVFIGIAIITVLIIVFLIYNHKQLPTKEDVFKITKNWSPATEEVYFVRKIDGDWLTIFRNMHSIMIARLEQNWLGYWEIKDDLGYESTLISTYYPPLEDEEFNWSAGSKAGIRSYYFGQIINPTIKRIEVETKKDFYEDALIISYEESRFFFVKSDGEMVMPVNIRGYSETGELIHSTIKPIKKDKSN
ncbi:hypothetical protein [Solibacillus daqui]|uniref:hypothetical protein n=1 Tax=Solibacillus daqui TaxID=2912187 RepID=UPI002366B648|nr:hypothetical protein [Solibacillus daqui]